MFRLNDSHVHPKLFDPMSGLNPRVQKRLDSSWAPVFYEHVFCQIDETLFAPLYADNLGRPNYPVNILLGLEIIKHFRDYTDLELVDGFFFDDQIKYALGVRDLDAYIFSERTIYEFRERLYTHALLHPENDLIYQQFKRLALHASEVLNLSTTEMRMDSTMLMSNIRMAGRLSLSYDVLTKAVKACPVEILPEQLARVQHLRSRGNS